MAFLTEDDYKPLITDNILRQVIQNDPTILAGAEMMAQSEMSSYLTRFDTAAIFAAVGDDRNKAIVMYLLDMTLYHLHSRVSPMNISRLRADRYKQAIEWLRMISYGELSPDLPLKTDEEGEVEDRLRFGSNDMPELRF